MGAWNHWLPSAYLLGDTHPHPGMSEALGVGPHQPHPASEELPRKPKPGTAFPSPVGQTMPEKQRRAARLLFEGEREKAWETRPHGFSWACKHLESLGWAVAAQHHPGTPLAEV